MTTFESKVKTILTSPDTIYRLLSDFSRFSPAVFNTDNIKDMIPSNIPGADSFRDKIKGFRATEDKCLIIIENQGEVGLKIIEREENKTIKVTGENIPFEFYLWFQLKEVAPNETKMKLTIKAELNMMYKFMLSGMIEKQIDKLADLIASQFNNYTATYN